MNATKKLITVAQGYLELGMYQEAWDALDEVSPERRYAPNVLLVRLEIYRSLKKWDAMASVAKHLTSALPEDPGYWITLAYAQRRYLGVEESEKTLFEALERFRENATIHYNLARCAAQLGRLDEAKMRLGIAIELDPEFREMAFEDPDLESLW
jgi:tetratricopeptide (TPR) repeat protein